MQVPNSIVPAESPVLADPVLGHLADVSARQGLRGLAARLSGVQRWLREDLKELNASIGTTSNEEHLAARAADHLLKSPGKRIRPMCVVLAARIGGRVLDEHVRGLAVAAELIHTATLLHDDVIDEGTERRGLPAARAVFGNSASVLAGDHLLVKALALVRVAEPSLLASMLDTLSEMVSAEAVQLARRGRFEPSREAYLQIVEGKTASLFAWSLMAGGSVGDLNGSCVSSLGHVGVALGVAFQLVDDALDFSGDSAAIGKDTLADLRDGKVTWPLILAAEAVPDVRVALEELAHGSSVDGGAIDVERTQFLVRAVRRSGAVEATRSFAQEQLRNVEEAIARLPANRARHALEAVLASAVERNR